MKHFDIYDSHWMKNTHPRQKRNQSAVPPSDLVEFMFSPLIYVCVLQDQPTQTFISLYLDLDHVTPIHIQELQFIFRGSHAVNMDHCTYLLVH